MRETEHEKLNSKSSIYTKRVHMTYIFESSLLFKLQSEKPEVYSANLCKLIYWFSCVHVESEASAPGGWGNAGLHVRELPAAGGHQGNQQQPVTKFGRVSRDNCLHQPLPLSVDVLQLPIYDYKMHFYHFNCISDPPLLFYRISFSFNHLSPPPPLLPLHSQIFTFPLSFPSPSPPLPCPNSPSLFPFPITPRSSPTPAGRKIKIDFLFVLASTLNTWFWKFVDWFRASESGLARPTVVGPEVNFA